MHNPPVRLKSVGRGKVPVAQVPAPDGRGEIIVTTDLTFDQPSCIVHGTQTIERRTGSDLPETLASVPVRFSLIDRASFEQMAHECGFLVEALFGDYQRSPFHSSESPCMVSLLRRNA